MTLNMWMQTYHMCNFCFFFLFEMFVDRLFFVLSVCIFCGLFSFFFLFLQTFILFFLSLLKWTKVIQILFLFCKTVRFLFLFCYVFALFSLIQFCCQCVDQKTPPDLRIVQNVLLETNFLAKIRIHNGVSLIVFC